MAQIPENFPSKPLWVCPRCGEKFVTPNMWHSCGKYSLQALFAKSEPLVFVLYQKFEQMVQTVGPVTIIPQKTRLVFQVRVRFGGCIPRKSYLLCNLAFPTRRENPRFQKIEQFAPHWVGHHFRIAVLEELDEEVAGWIEESYHVMGEQKHLT